MKNNKTTFGMMLDNINTSTKKTIDKNICIKSKSDLLPGQAVYNISPHELNKGMKVFDKDSNKVGIISDIRETKPEWIEVFIKFNKEKNEIEAHLLPNCVIL